MFREDQRLAVPTVTATENYSSGRSQRPKRMELVHLRAYTSASLSTSSSPRHRQRAAEKAVQVTRPSRTPVDRDM